MRAWAGPGRAAGAVSSVAIGRLLDMRARTALLAASVAALLALLGASAAPAHQISKRTAEKTMRDVAKMLCEDDPQCVKFNDDQFFCDRRKRDSHVHRVICTATWVRRTEDGERVVCRAKVVLRIRQGDDPTQPGVKIGEPVCR